MQTYQRATWSNNNTWLRRRLLEGAPLSPSQPVLPKASGILLPDKSLIASRIEHDAHDPVCARAQLPGCKRPSSRLRAAATLCCGRLVSALTVLASGCTLRRVTCCWAVISLQASGGPPGAPIGLSRANS